MSAASYFEHNAGAPQWDLIEMPVPEPLAVEERELTDDEIQLFRRRLEDQHQERAAL